MCACNFFRRQGEGGEEDAVPKTNEKSNGLRPQNPSPKMKCPWLDNVMDWTASKKPFLVPNTALRVVESV